MTRLPDGSHVCDKCGSDCGNGGVLDCLVVSDLDEENNTVRNLHFCRDREGEGKTIKGCAKKVLSPANLKHYEESRA